uniref:Uncharacterized protein n=1 Tax=Vespula pensylvanica TaxID=30213 RepID=A0A834P7P9_VESPE|nr:hypothetical protein H0235_004696 [Vespula pensylvanica]
MSGTSRKVKNPLLSAAGMGSPFEYYPENALLVPVTPATPAVLRDELRKLQLTVGNQKLVLSARAGVREPYRCVRINNAPTIIAAISPSDKLSQAEKKSY